MKITETWIFSSQCTKFLFKRPMIDVFILLIIKIQIDFEVRNINII